MIYYGLLPNTALLNTVGGKKEEEEACLNFTEMPRDTELVLHTHSRDPAGRVVRAKNRFLFAQMQFSLQNIIYVLAKVPLCAQVWGTTTTKKSEETECSSLMLIYSESRNKRLSELIKCQNTLWCTCFFAPPSVDCAGHSFAYCWITCDRTSLMLPLCSLSAALRL